MSCRGKGGADPPGEYSGDSRSVFLREVEVLPVVKDRLL